jgi:hypothetical protein
VRAATAVKQARKDFFSGEKNQKTFVPRRRGKIPAMASIVEPAKK